MDFSELKAVCFGFDDESALLNDYPALLQQVRRLAGEYLKSRIDWVNAEPDKLAEIDIARSRAHNAFISALDALTRYAAAKGSGLEWRRVLSHGGDTEERKRIGDFACYIAFELAIQAR